MNSDMVKKQPLVSVIITNYNYGQYIKEALDSVIAQTYKNIELIVIDDGSTDDSVEIIDRFKKDHPSTVVIKQKNKGVVFARNKGLDILSGDFVLIMDADDIIPSHFIEGMYQTSKREKADVVYCDLEMFGEVSGRMDIKGQSVENLKKFSPSPICQFMRVSAVKGTRFDTKMNTLAHEDNDFFFSLFAKGLKFAKSKEVYKYRIHKKARNPDSKHRKHYESLIFIYMKYHEQYSELRDALVDMLEGKDEQIDEWHTVADERLTLIRTMEDDFKRLLIKKENELRELKNSKRYKIGNAIVAPASAIKSILNKKAR